MGIMVYSLLWVMQDFVHQPYLSGLKTKVESLIEYGAFSYGVH